MIDDDHATPRSSDRSFRTSPDEAGRTALPDVVVEVWCEARYASTLRLVAAAAGADAGFTVDELDDLRLGISEAFSVFADRTPRARLRASFTVRDASVSITLETSDGPLPTLEADELTLAIFRAVVDHHTISGEQIALHKAARQANDATRRHRGSAGGRTPDA